MLMINRPQHLALFILMYSLMGPTPAFAQMTDIKPMGMKHIIVTPNASDAKAAQTSNIPSKAGNEEQHRPDEPAMTAPRRKSPPKETVKTAPDLKPLDMKEALVKPEQFKTWDKMALAVTARKKDEINKLLVELRTHGSVVPPQGLFLSAQSLAMAGKMEDAALYYMAGQVRMEFDMSRWPAQQDIAYTNLKDYNARKSYDQGLPINSDKKMVNPHSYVGELSTSVGMPILEWIMADPERLAKSLDRAEEWDAATAYEYEPGYDLPKPIPFAEWSKKLPKVRAAFFGRMRTLYDNISAYKAANPAHSR